MERVARFEKVSRAVFVRDLAKYFPSLTEKELESAYDRIALPGRATSGSAGYDFRTPAGFALTPGSSVTVPTGIRVRMREDHVLLLFPRSGLGFRYRLQLNNTVGVIDSDYYYAENEGHILIKRTNDSREEKTVTLTAGDAFAQGVFLTYGITEDDAAGGVRTGGFGSTG